jgi:hypothetical protein
MAEMTTLRKEMESRSKGTKGISIKDRRGLIQISYSKMIGCSFLRDVFSVRISI